MKCAYCENKANRSHCNHDTGIIEELCEFHYAKWHPGLTQKEILKLFNESLDRPNVCPICMSPLIYPVVHHTCYFPEMKMIICARCHVLIHKGQKYPESDEFYGRVKKHE